MFKFNQLSRLLMVVVLFLLVSSVPVMAQEPSETESPEEAVTAATETPSVITVVSTDADGNTTLQSVDNNATPIIILDQPQQEPLDYTVLLIGLFGSISLLGAGLGVAATVYQRNKGNIPQTVNDLQNSTEFNQTLREAINALKDSVPPSALDKMYKAMSLARTATATVEDVLTIGVNAINPTKAHTFEVEAQVPDGVDLTLVQAVTNKVLELAVSGKDLNKVLQTLKDV